MMEAQTADFPYHANATDQMEIVVVDDDAMITDLIGTFLNLSLKNVHVHSFNDPMQARDYIRDHEVNVLITDYKMPRLDGVQLIESTSPRTKRIMVSGYVSEITGKRLQELHTAVFEKPVAMQQLIATITNRTDESVA
jgi:two-component system response regulator YesN